MRRSLGFLLLAGCSAGSVRGGGTSLGVPSASGSWGGGGGHAAPTLAAGEIDDNFNLGDYLEYTRSYPFRDVPKLDLSDRVVLTVYDADGRPAWDQTVEIRDGDARHAPYRATTDAFGQVLVPVRAAGLNPRSRGGLMVHAVRPRFSATPAGVGLPMGDGESAFVQLPFVHGRDPHRATIDVAFCVDTTSSMDDEVAALRSTLLSVVERVRAVQPYGRLRIGGVAYRDQGEAYVAQPFDFTDDPSEAQRTILRVDTAGGGDGPEAVNEALDVAVNRLSWTPEGALRVLFLIGDAAPHLERGRPYTETMRRAAEKGIKIVTVGCSGLDPTGEFVWRQLAAFTLGRFAFVSYGGTADVHVDAFPMNDLDDILARAVIREVEALHRGAAVIAAPAPQVGWQQQAPPPPMAWPPLRPFGPESPQLPYVGRGRDSQDFASWGWPR